VQLRDTLERRRRVRELAPTPFSAELSEEAEEGAI
jgi:hypothetical protein